MREGKREKKAFLSYRIDKCSSQGISCHLRTNERWKRGDDSKTLVSSLNNQAELAHLTSSPPPLNSPEMSFPSSETDLKKAAERLLLLVTWGVGDHLSVKRRFLSLTDAASARMCHQ